MTERLGIALGADTNDLVMDAAGNLGVVFNAEAVGQHAKQRLNTYGGEWFLDTTAGVPWLDEILGRSYDPALAESLVKSELFGTDGVTEITSFSISFDKTTRGLRIRDIGVLTDYDQEVSI